MALKRGIVELEEFNKNWFEEYNKEKNFLLEKLKEKAIEIHHVGSTSIEGLMAKPVIDVLVVIEALEKINEIEEILNKYGYSNRGHQGVEDRYFFAICNTLSDRNSIGCAFFLFRTTFISPCPSEHPPRPLPQHPLPPYANPRK